MFGSTVPWHRAVSSLRSIVMRISREEFAEPFTGLMCRRPAARLARKSQDCFAGLRVTRIGLQTRAVSAQRFREASRGFIELGQTEAGAAIEWIHGDGPFVGGARAFDFS